MGDIANATINGFFCEDCGCIVDGKEPGFPRKCDDCEDLNDGALHMRAGSGKTEDSTDIWQALKLPGTPTTAQVLERLDAVVPGEWDWTVENIEKPFATETHYNSFWHVKGRLQILGVIREHFGSATNPIEAAGDCFLRVAMLFGMGDTNAMEAK